MKRAVWSKGRAYCSREGCKNDKTALARLAPTQGRVTFSDYWVPDDQATPPRFHRADRKTFTVAPSPNIARHITKAQRATLRHSRASREVDMPAVFVCPTCKMPNLLDDPKLIG